MTDHRQQVDQDIKDLEKLGYVQELFRGLGGFSNFAVSFSVISILTGATQLYGYGLQHGGPFQTTVGWLFVSLFTLTVALSMAELASAYPTAGALYHWSSFLGGRALGWFTACFNTIGQFAIVAGIDYGLSLFIINLIGWTDTRPVVVGVYAVLLLSHALLNHMGIRLVAWLNNFSAWYHVAVVFLILVLLAAKGFVQSPSYLLTFSHQPQFTPGYSFLIGLLLAQWTLTGYDASAHVTEETVDPRRNAPKGIFWAVVVSVVFGFLMLCALSLSIEDLSSVAARGEGAFSAVMKSRLGDGAGTVIVALTAGAMWLCGLAGMTSASRMIYAFARDGGLPFSKVWARVSTRHQTPHCAIWGLTVLALGLALSIDIYSAVVSMATISLYLSYGLPIVARIVRRARNKKDILGPWNLGRWSFPVACLATLWVIFITIVFVLPPNDQAGKGMGLCFIFLILFWFGYVGRRFKGPPYHPFG